MNWHLTMLKSGFSWSVGMTDQEVGWYDDEHIEVLVVPPEAVHSYLLEDIRNDILRWESEQ